MEHLRGVDGWAIIGRMATLMHLQNIGQQKGYRIPREIDIAVRRRVLGRVIHLLTEHDYIQIDNFKFKKDRSYINLKLNGFPNLNENTVILIDGFPVMKKVDCESNRHARVLKSSR